MSWVSAYKLKCDPFGTNDLDENQLSLIFEDRDFEKDAAVNGIRVALDSRKFGISGLAGVGKTTLLNKIISELRSNTLLPIKIDLGQPANETELLFLFIAHLLNESQLSLYKKAFSKNTEKIVAEMFDRLYYTIRTESGTTVGISSTISAGIHALWAKFESKLERKMTKNKATSKITRPIEGQMAFAEFGNLVRQLREDGVSVVIGLDEADKWGADLSKTLINNIKLIITNQHCHVIVVGNSTAFSDEMCNYIVPAHVISISPFLDPRTGEPSGSLYSIISKRLEYYALPGEKPAPFDQATLAMVFKMSSGVIKTVLSTLSRLFVGLGPELNGKTIDLPKAFGYLTKAGLVSRLNEIEQQYVDAMLKIGKPVNPADLVEPLKQRGFDHKTGYVRKRLIAIEKKGWIKASEGTRVGGRGSAKRYVVQLSTVRNTGTV
jgi:hypothetical protein